LGSPADVDCFVGQLSQTVGDLSFYRFSGLNSSQEQPTQMAAPKRFVVNVWSDSDWSFEPIGRRILAGVVENGRESIVLDTIDGVRPWLSIVPKKL